MSVLNHGPYKNKAANVISKHQEQIILNWINDVKEQIPGAHHLSKAIIIDTFPVFLTNLMDILDEDTQENNPQQVAEEHGEERALITQFTFENIHTEYKLIKKHILSFLGESASAKDLMVINQTCHEAAQNATEAFMANKHIL